MDVLPGFWHAAARLSGRVDWSVPLRQVAAARLPTLSLEGLTTMGIPPHRAMELVIGRDLPLADPALTLADPDWPAALIDLPYAPAVLFTRGDRQLLRAPALAVVGTRRATDSGRRLARQLARATVELGAVVVSGLAHGIDSEAHATVRARTIAVLGQSLDLPLDRHQQRLADEIVEAGGLLLSEYPPPTRPARWTFPQRNRVIAGLAGATVVVEAASRSGALITARQAADYGREVLAVPGSPLAEASQGCLDLLAEGARLCRGAEDLASALGLHRTPRAVEDPAASLLALVDEPRSLDDLVEPSGMDPVTLLRRLSALELAGLVARRPGDRYQRITRT